LELLSTISATVALSIENARFSEEIKSAYREVSSLNRAKDKVINHLSHELKTPLTVLVASLNILKRKLADFPDHAWKPTIDRAERNLERILEMQYQIQDIMQDRQFKTHDMLSVLLEVCTDELEALVADEVGEGHPVEAVRKRIQDFFGPISSKPSKIRLDALVKERLQSLKSSFNHRDVQIIPHFETVNIIYIPKDVIQKVVDGLIKNAIENTPDEGKIEISVLKKGEGIEFVVHDYGVGISEDDQRRIFEGFFSTQDTINYSTKKPFDFNAGGKGADLLRMKIFAERYNFKIDLESTLCPYLEDEPCPGKISQCPRCKDQNGCHQSGGTTFTVYFPGEKGKGG
jgi:signal transduction histidine kinase